MHMRLLSRHLILFLSTVLIIYVVIISTGTDAQNVSILISEEVLSSSNACPNDPLTYNIHLNAGSATAWHPYVYADDNSDDVIGNPITLYYVSRHGSRYPISDDSIAISDLQANIRNVIDALPKSCFKEKYLRYFINEFAGFSLKFQGELVNQGIETNIALGDQYAKTFSNTIFHKKTRKYPLPNESYSMSASSVPRSIQSGITFFNSLLSTINGKPASSFIITTTDAQEQLLHQNMYCPKFINYVASQKAAIESFENRMLTPVLQRFLNRVGLDSNSKVFTTTDMSNLWNACTYGLTVYDKEFSRVNAHFCEIFSDDDVDILNYIEDTAMYFKYGYGSSNPISYEQTLPLLKNIIMKLGSAIDDAKNGNIATVYGGFGHEETNIPLYTLLQLFQETDDSQKLSLSDTPEDVVTKKNRVWKLKDFGTFSTNIAFVLTKDSLDQFYVSLYVNKTYLRFPHCGGAYSCPFEAFVSIYDKLYAGLIDKSLSELCTV